jgi:hypothetical protein
MPEFYQHNTHKTELYTGYVIYEGEEVQSLFLIRKPYLSRTLIDINVLGYTCSEIIYTHLSKVFQIILV